ncbi:glycosyltransferase [Haliscomenobacter hydrossis]|uniref:Glycosyl transferase family 2 n=1 Tax=Haliscomenobacter hydrossis (strain ATCC 27775 / DSM 1100 / LMG 10767 / O) TaxID=760192 RepID=F4KPK2_HALH1|nr:glycosyltransferase [Haliscomenobacter hydrossis]AEE50940.1 glycosyl transferase family 2 [Haliscomenobacter hydrossis DSM 1100]
MSEEALVLVLPLSFSLGIAYFLLIRYFLWHWNQIPAWKTPVDFQPRTRVSILIPARNEAANIGSCLRSILAQNYPETLMEVIVVDDHSEDTTAALVLAIKDPRIRLIHLVDYPLPNGLAFKKHGLSTAITQATGELIVCTDADCQMGADWLASMVSFYQDHSVQMIAGSVNFHQEKNLLERFQSLDFMGMMLLTGAGLRSGKMRMGNGANLAYTRSAFAAVGGFNGIDHLASGDDLLLMHKIEKQYPGQVLYLKSLAATVYTLAMPDWRSFFQQRLRWGTKNAAYQEWRITAVLGMVFVLCWSILLHLIFLPLAPVTLGISLLIQWACKIWADDQLLRAGANFFHRQDLLRIFWPAQLLHVLYIASVGFWANVQKKYSWKGRKVR